MKDNTIAHDRDVANKLIAELSVKKIIIVALENEVKTLDKTASENAKEISCLRTAKAEYSEKSAENLRRLIIRRKQVKILKDANQEKQNAIDSRDEKINQLFAQLQEQAKVIERLNRNVELANETKGTAAPANSRNWGGSQYGKFSDAMAHESGYVRKTQGGVAGAVG